MYTVNMNEYRIKQDEMFRQAEKFRLIQAARKNHSPAARTLKTLWVMISTSISS